MENHPLNLAHQQHRKAEALLKNNRYDEAIQCHQNAAELLLHAMKSTTSSIAIESITLQHSYHLKQKDIIKTKKEQYARIKKAMENIKRLSKEPMNSDGSNNAQLQIAIYKAIDETDSLLHVLTVKNNDIHEIKNLPIKDMTDGKKTEKPPQTVVEELQILSQNLHSLVEQLVLQVEVLKDENSSLKERVQYLEKERMRYLNFSSPIDLSNQYNFTTVDMSDGFSTESITQPVVNLMQANKINEQNQPLFDLSALKD